MSPRGIASATALPPKRRRQLSHDRVEHRLGVGHRAADHAQDLGRRRLLLERLLGLVEQAHVLDRDHRLVGEGLQQLDVVRRELLRARAGHAEHADRDARRAAAGSQSALRKPRLRAIATWCGWEPNRPRCLPSRYRAGDGSARLPDTQSAATGTPAAASASASSLIGVNAIRCKVSSVDQEDAQSTGRR